MSPVKQKSILNNRVSRTELINWRLLEFLQEDSFKELTEAARTKLKASIIANNFTQPFYVWQEPHTGTLFCLDGKHRTMLLNELSDQGYDIPEQLPATFINCDSMDEAAKLVLTYSSMYAKITQQGLFDFIEAFNLDYKEVREQVDIPDFSTERFEQKFDQFNVKNDADEYEVDIVTDNIIVQEGDIFELGAHRIVCGSFLHGNNLEALIGNERARIVITDPPYNLPTNFFLKDNRHNNNHDDFAMGAGEMSDDEFVEFLMAIMSRSCLLTMPGAIHYIFMDWRHMWHMMEAARKVYGSTIPKQLCVWKKDVMANGSFYRAQQELCFIFSNNAAKSLWNNDLLDNNGFYKNDEELVFIFKNGDAAPHLSHLDLQHRIRSNVWNYPSANSMKNPDRMELKNHPTPKPVAMIADAILDTTNPGDLVIDFFLGSGTTLIACEKTGRGCRGTDVEPKFIQSIIKRYVLYCNKNAIPVHFSHVNGNLTLNDFINEKHNGSAKNH